MTMNINYTMRDIPSARSAYNSMLETNRAIDQTIDVLTSKMRINKAGDDAAGLAISERMRGEISGLDRAMTNIQDGMTMLQIAAGGIEEISQVVQKLRELAVQAANGTYTASDREALNAEFLEVRKEIDKVANTTVFNGKKLLNGNASALWSTSDLGLSVILNGAISELGGPDGEISAAGDYDLSIMAKAGQAEVQKMGLFHRNYDAVLDPHFEIEGTGLYYDSNGQPMTINEAVQNFGYASWVQRPADAPSSTTFKFSITGTNEAGEADVLDLETTITAGTFYTPGGFANFMNAELAAKNEEHGTDYKVYFNEETGHLGIRSSREFTINDRAGGFQKLFGSFLQMDGVTSASASANNTTSASVNNAASSASASAGKTASSPAPASAPGTVITSSFSPARKVGVSASYDVRVLGSIDINDDGDYSITGTTTSQREITIADGVTATITLSDLNIGGASRIYIGQNANVTIVSEGTNSIGANARSPIVLYDGSSLTLEGNGTLNAAIWTEGISNITINSGTLNAEGATRGGIQVEEGSTLTINGGTVNASGGNNSAAIGSTSGKASGTITINDGTVKATGGVNGAAIGSGNGGAVSGTITVNGGDVTATGGSDAAGIGTGYRGSNNGTITVNDGTVTATGGGYGAGIGGGHYSDGGNINVNGGNVTAKSPGYAAGIGGGSGGSGGNITITDGTVNASSDGMRGAGIGSGSSTNGNNTSGNITISGGVVTAKGGQDAAGIGTGYMAEGGSVNISGGLVIAEGGSGGAGIGSGNANDNDYTKGLDITITGGNISALSKGYGAGIGGGQNTDGGNITITGGNVSAAAGESAASIGGGAAGGSGTIKIQDGMYFGDNTGFVKIYGNPGHIGAGSYILVGDDVYAESRYLNSVIPAGSTAAGDITLREVDSFYDDDGVFLLESPQKLTITQGDGNRTNITLYADDTLDEVAKKLNDAIAFDLGQASYLGSAEGSMNFARYIEDEDITEGTSESVHGSIIVRSALTGKAGELRFGGSQAMLDALALSTLQESRENEFTISIKRADTEETLATRQHITGNRFKGAISQNVDIEFDRMTGIFTGWNDKTKKFSYSTAGYDATVHLTDNSTNLQIGADEKERLRFTVADLSVKALNLETLDISDRQRATEAITSIDAAIDKVSRQNAHTGAMINRLETAYDTVSVLHEHATESESRIRDADMAKMMMRFTNLKLLSDAQQSVFMQANQQANNLLSILR